MANFRDGNFQHLGNAIPADLPCTEEELRELKTIDNRIGQIVTAAKQRQDKSYKQMGTF